MAEQPAKPAPALPQPPKVNIQRPPGQPAVARPTTVAASPRPVLNVQEEFSKIRSLYKDYSNTKANFLIQGRHGQGKTFNLIYAPGPILLHSFDPGGARCIPDEQISSGRFIVDGRFENEIPSEPKAFRAWETEFRRLKRLGFYDHIGTYALDFTRWAASMMNEILKSRGRKIPEKAEFGKDPDIIPEQSDYLVQQKTVAQYLAEITSLPCNVVCIAHIATETDKEGKLVRAMVMMDGKKFAENMPSLFDEVYIARSRPNPSASSGRNYFYRTTPEGVFEARSRLAKGGVVIQKEEPQNIADILKRAGFPWEDKPTFI